jgi:predicted nucleic acid-binding Zn finger protein
MRARIYELGRYLVESESGRDPYLVDAIESWCDCDDFRIRVASLGEKETCKHLEAGRRQFTQDFDPATRAAIIAQQVKK